MNKVFIPALVLSFLTISCAKNQQKEALPPSQDTLVVQDKAPKISGNFSGTFPCASCPGIEMNLTLNADKTYVLESNYLESEDGKITEKGNFEISENGKYLTLHEEPTPRIFLITENALYLVEKIGIKTQAHQYKLSKQ